jgi:hypothetical protein
MVRWAALILCIGSVSQAALYINGVRVDGLANVKLHNVDVDIDAQGDVRVTAKGYVVNVGEARTNTSTSTATSTSTSTSTSASPNTKTATPNKTRYVLTMSENGDPQWDIDVFLNGTYVRRFSAGDTSAPIDVTRMVKAGDNSLRFHAVKQEGTIRSVQPSDLIQLTLDADQTLVNGRHELTHIYSYRRTAAETGMFDESVSVSVR